MLLIQKCAFADGELIWNYKHDNFIKEIISGKQSPEELKKQSEFDSDLKKDLGIELVYTNLSECLQIAVDNNFNMKIKNSQKREHYWNYQNAKAQFLPDVNYTLDMQHYNGTFVVGGIVPDSVDETAVISDFNFVWSTVKQGKLFFLNAQRKHNYRAADSNYMYTKDEVILNTTLAYYDLLKQKLKFEVLHANIDDREQQLRLTKARYDVGLGDRFDVLRAEAQLAQAKQQYIATFNRVRLAQAKLANIMGVDVIIPIFPSEHTVEIRNLIEEKYQINELYNMAVCSRDDINATKQEIKALQAERSSNYMDFVPKLDVYASKGLQGTLRLGLYGNQTVGFELTVPLGENLGVGTMTKVKAYNAKIEAKQYELTNLTRRVKESIIGSYYDSKTALERIESAKKEVLASDQSAHIAYVKMKVGNATFLDVLQAQTTKITSRESLIEAIIDYNKAQTQLLFDSGIISVSGVLKDYSQPIATTPQP